jgi:hypothetical protein
MSDRKGIRDPPKTVTYTYPEGTTKTGRVVDRVEELMETEGADYLWVVEHIQWDGEDEHNVRFGYYRRPENSDEWGWGSQTTFNAPHDTTTNLIGAAQEKGFL